jgi:hypothetical protein
VSTVGTDPTIDVTSVFANFEGDSAFTNEDIQKLSNAIVTKFNLDRSLSAW